VSKTQVREGVSPAECSRHDVVECLLCLDNLSPTDVASVPIAQQDKAQQHLAAFPSPAS
jgi:hypothetical protein